MQLIVPNPIQAICRQVAFRTKDGEDTSDRGAEYPFELKPAIPGAYSETLLSHFRTCTPFAKDAPNHTMTLLAHQI